MPIVNMRDMLYHAYENSYAVGAFDLVSLDFLEAVISAAEKCRASVILSIAEPHFAHYDFELMLSAVEAAAKRASVPVAIQLDHGRSLQSTIDAIKLGCNGVMLDASDLPIDENIKITRTVTEMAHACGVPVVGELGYVAGMEGEGAEQHPGETSYTKPHEAKVYVERSGVDFLAVSIGTVQGRMKGRAKLDFQRLKQLNEMVNIPLVIHGGSGLNESQFRKMTALGVVKINYYTALSDLAAKVMRNQAKLNSSGSFIEMKQGVKQAIEDEVERCLKIWGGAGRAAEVLTQCEPWLPVEHLIIHNVKLLNEQQLNERQVIHNMKLLNKQQLNAVLTEGRQLLSEIPGVRGVFTGEAIREGEQYRLCWIVHLANKKMVQSIQKHANYIKFAKNVMLRPYAENVLSIDFLDSSSIEWGSTSH